ncbi:uncharacterized protein LOC117294665 [Asterias rubens]|uniref:uncharacterized protein LOC117294665 n=1 Tax=Asterias rubens TaxID=7604 RepID=UPI001454EB7E|nr:uncharacterized protein LOC117294665 [Asterias rubens]XP_033633073.1 uncharacterized protein LOC117294665 [Asterias rubens]
MWRPDLHLDCLPLEAFVWLRHNLAKQSLEGITGLSSRTEMSRSWAMWMDVRQKTIYPDVTSYSGGGSQPASQLHIYPDVTSYLDVTSDPDVTSYSGGGSQLHTPVAAVSQPGCTQDVFLIRQQSHVMMTTSPDESIDRVGHVD